MFPQTLPKATAALFEKLADKPFLQQFYLSGRTGLALQLGHRESEGLDFFTADQFDPSVLQRHLLEFGELTEVSVAEGTLNLFLQDVKLQFLHYPYRLLEQPVLWNGVLLSSVIDIACTKLITISMRGSKKDFIDLYFLLQQFTLQELFDQLEKKYQETGYNKAHIVKSLVFFEDAEAQPMPRMHTQAEWVDIKSAIVQASKSLHLDS